MTYGFAKLHPDGRVRLPVDRTRNTDYIPPRVLSTLIRRMAGRDPLPVLVIDRGPWMKIHGRS